MGYGVEGAGDWNDDVLNGGGAPGSQIIDPNDRLWNPHGTGSAYDKDVNRYRQRGAERRDPFEVYQGKADKSRTMQLGSLGLLEQQANGTAPSSAAILSQRANQGAAQQVAAAGIRKGGPGAALAGMGAAMPAASNQALQMNAQNASSRAGEISRGQTAFAQGANAAQGQDIQVATANAQLAAQQRALDEARQQANERLAWDTRKAQLNNSNESKTQIDTANLNRARLSAAQEAEDWAKVTGYGNMALGTVTGGVAAINQANAAEAKKKGGTSDERAKRDVMPMGSLGSLERY